jgi:hypothetical protein
MDIALSSQDLKDIFDGELKILLYGDVQKYRTVDELLEPYDRVCILYNWTKNMGHWVCLFKKGDTIYFFDSFGSIPDGRTNMGQIPKQLKYKFGMDYKYLTDLLYNSPYTIDYNPKVLQDKYSSTCGRWCAVRMSMDNLTTEQFNKHFTDDQKLNDHYVIYLTDEEE